MDHLPQTSSSSEDKSYGSSELSIESKELVREIHEARAEIHKIRSQAAIRFLRRVKDTYMDNIEKYSEFLNLMKDFMARRIGTMGIVSRVKELFRDHQELICDFNYFLPIGYEIDVTIEDSSALRHLNLTMIQVKNQTPND